MKNKNQETPTIHARIKNADEIEKASKGLRKAMAAFSQPRLVASKKIEAGTPVDYRHAHAHITQNDMQMRARICLRAAAQSDSPEDAMHLAMWAANLLALRKQGFMITQFYVDPTEAHDIEGLVMKPELTLAG